MSAVLEGYHLSTKLIGKLTGYAAVVAAAFAIAVALIAVAPANEAKAAAVATHLSLRNCRLTLRYRRLS